MAVVNAFTASGSSKLLLPQVAVPADQLAFVTTDSVLTAELLATMALCFYDAVEEPGLLLHLPILPHRDNLSELTDVMVTGNLELLEQATRQLRKLAPAARHWQCRLVAQVPDQDAAVGSAAALVIECIRDFLNDSVVARFDAQVRFGGRTELMFRPAMGEVRVKG